MSRTARSFRLEHDVEGILDEVAGGQSSATEYISKLIRDAERDWRSALDTLAAAGWRRAELRAALDALNGYGMVSEHGRPASWLAIELADAERLNGVCMQHDASPERWAAHVDRLGKHETEARALAALAREFWRHNPRVERAVDRVDAAHASGGA